MALKPNSIILNLLAHANHDQLMTVSVETVYMKKQTDQVKTNQKARIYLRITSAYDKMIYKRGRKYLPSVVFALSEHRSVSPQLRTSLPQ